MQSSTALKNVFKYNINLEAIAIKKRIVKLLLTIIHMLLLCKRPIFIIGIKTFDENLLSIDKKFKKFTKKKQSINSDYFET